MFKTGDTAIRTDAGYDVTAGREYLISAVKNNFFEEEVKIQSDSGEMGWYKSCYFIKPAQEAPAELDNIATVEARDNDPISHPSHYTADFEIEPITFIMKNKLPFPVGNIIKYACRYDKKGTPIEDLKKVQQYAQFLIDELEAK